MGRLVLRTRQRWTLICIKHAVVSAAYLGAPILSRAIAPYGLKHGKCPTIRHRSLRSAASSEAGAQPELKTEGYNELPRSRSRRRYTS